MIIPTICPFKVTINTAKPNFGPKLGDLLWVNMGDRISNFFLIVRHLDNNEILIISKILPRKLQLPPNLNLYLHLHHKARKLSFQ